MIMLSIKERAGGKGAIPSLFHTVHSWPVLPLHGHWAAKMALNNAKLVSTVAMLVQHLAEKKYGELEILTDTIRMGSDEIKQAVESYRGSILPTVRPQDIDTIEIQTATEDCWSVNVRLHTDREGPSDLTMSLTLIESNTEFYGVELDDIHVL